MRLFGGKSGGKARDELNRRLVLDQFPVGDGHVEIPNRPGLGFEIDEDLLNAYTVGGT